MILKGDFPKVYKSELTTSDEQTPCSMSLVPLS